MKEITEDQINNFKLALGMEGIEVEPEHSEKLLRLAQAVEEKGSDFSLGDLDAINKYIHDKYHVEEEVEV